MGEPGDGKPGVLERIRGRLSGRRAASSERAMKRRAIKAEREARNATRPRADQGPPNVGGGV